ncbi:MAG: VWA domain-containing protein [Planctomycetota bacterium]
MQFEAPACLLFCLVAIVPWLRIRGAASGRDARHSLLRSLAIVFVGLALARPVRVVPATEAEATSHAIVWDRSASVTAEADRAAKAAIESLIERTPEVIWSLHEIAGEGRDAFEAPPEVECINVDTADNDEGTPLLQAVAAGLRRAAPGADHRVSVWSDGLSAPPETSLRQLHAEFVAAGAALDFERLGGPAGDLRMTSLEPQDELRVGTSGRVLVRMEGAGQRVDLVLRSEARELARLDGVRVDGDSSFALEIEPREPGFMNVELEATVVEGADPRGGDLALAATLAVQAPRKLLYFGDRMQDGAARLGELVGPGFEIIEARKLAGSGGDAGPTLDGTGLRSSDLIVIDDCPAAQLSLSLQREIQSAVQDAGVGLVMAGGEAAFGPGGYHDQPLESILPVEFVQKEEKRDPSTTLVVIIDTSGSMGGNRVQLAKEVSRLAIRRLLPHDKVGLVEFYGAKRWAVPIQPASNSIEIERALNRLDAGGGTVILPAIEEAYYGLKNVSTRYKHVLILTDGGVETGSFEPLLRRMADDGMTVSTVLIGPDAHSEFLVNIANWGQGRFYSVPNRFNLPEILLKQPASAKLPAYRPGTVTVEATGLGQGWWGTIDAASGVPDLGGYVESRLQPGAESVLETSDERHPIVASWRHGLGRVTTIATELTGPGTRSWAEWSEYGEFLDRVFERTAADAGAPFEYRLTRRGGEALLVAERRAGAGRPAGSGAPEDVAPVAMLMDSERLDSTEVAFQQVAPDRFEARFPFHGGGASLRIAAGASRSVGGAGVLSRSATFLALDSKTGELQVASSQADRLEALAARVAASPAPRRSAPVRLQELAPLLAALALLTYLGDVLYRRWPPRSQVGTEP